MTPRKIIIKYAILTTLIIGVFFLLSKLLGLQENPYLRFLNLFFVLFGIRQAIKVNIEQNKETDYLSNLGLGLQTSALAVILSIAGVMVYVEFIDRQFIEAMNNSFLIAGDLDKAEIFITLLIEGMASSFIGSFMVMQFYKNHDKLTTVA